MICHRKKLVRALTVVGVLTLIAGAAQGATLQEVVQRTLVSSPDLLVDVTERLARDQELERAKGGYLPTLDLVAGAGRERSRNATTDDEWKWLTRKEASLIANQLIFDGMYTPSEIDRQAARVNSQAYRVYGVSQDVAADTVEVYLEVLRRQSLLELARQNLKVHERIRDQIQARSESGVSSRADFAQIAARVALAQSNTVTEETNLRDAETNYVRVTGEVPENLSPVPPVKERLPATRDEAVAQAIANNAVLQSAGADIQAAQAQHEASKSGYYPRVDLELSSTWSEDVQGYDGEEDYLTAMLNLRWNLFNGGRDRARDRQTAELVNEAKEVRNRTHRQVEESIRLAWAAYRASEGQAGFLRQHVEESETTRDAYAKQFKLGQRSLLDLLNTENEVFEARRNELSNTYDGLFAQYRLLRGMSVLTDVLGLTVPAEAKTL